MTREELYEAMTDIEDRYIEEADPARLQKRRRNLRPFAAIAAALVLVIGATALVSRSGLLQKRADSVTSESASRATGEIPEAAEEADMAPAEALAEKQKSEDVADEAATLEGAASDTTEYDAELPELSATVYWNGAAYEPVETALLPELPEECTLADTLKTEAGAVYRTDEEALSGASVWVPTDGSGYLFVEYADGFQRYEKQQ